MRIRWGHLLAGAVVVTACINVVMIGVVGLMGGHTGALALLLFDLGQLPWAMTFLRLYVWLRLLDRVPPLPGQAPSLFFWVGLVLLLAAGPFLHLSDHEHAFVEIVIIVLFVIDWWWRGPGKRHGKRLAATVLKKRKALAWGIEAKRPVPT